MKIQGEVDRALRRAMLSKLLSVIPSAVEESLTSHKPVAAFFHASLATCVSEQDLFAQTNS
jgi:hypothetical protein